MMILVILIAGQCALVAIAAVHGLAQLASVTPPVDIFVGSGGWFWIELVVLVGMFLAYARGTRDLGLAPRTLFVALIAVTLLAVLQAPTTSRDIYSYVTLGRTAAIYDLDPYTALYPIVPGDLFGAFVWYRGPSNYGPVTLLLFIPAAWLSQLHPALGVVFLKLVGGAAHVASSWLVWRLASAIGRDPEQALFLFGFNPLLLHELVGNGHNDGWAVTLVLASLWLIHRERWRLGGLIALIPMMIKLSFLATTGATAVMLAFRRRYAALAVMGLAFVAVAGALYVLLSPDLHQLLQITDPAAAGRVNSIFHWLELAIIRAKLAPPEAAIQLTTGLAQLGMVAFAAAAVWRCTKIREIDDLVTELARLFLILLLFGPRIWPWYLAWVMPFAVLSRSPDIRLTAILFSCTSLFLYTPDSSPMLHTMGTLSALLVPIIEWLLVRLERAR